MKRLFDIVLSLLLLVVLGPVLCLIGFSILAFEGRPVFFKQARVGIYGISFKLIKFRTMSIMGGSERGSFDAGSSVRVTRFGRLLRRSKLDELPQLINVLRGEMSLVGPRPEVRKWVDVFPERWAKIHQIRPGITDPASILYRNEERLLAQSNDPERTYQEEVLPHKLSLYEEYVDEHSFWGDIRIIFQTFKALFQ